jgi:hypothetical protein
MSHINILIGPYRMTRLIGEDSMASVFYINMVMDGLGLTIIYHYF